MKSSSRRHISWSFSFLGRRRSRPCSTSVFYCHDSTDDGPVVDSTDQEMSGTEPREPISPVSGDFDLDDSDGLATFCCGLRKLPAKSTSFDSQPRSPVVNGGLGIVSSSGLKMAGESHGLGFDSSALVPCKRDSLYPQASACDKEGRSEDPLGELPQVLAPEEQTGEEEEEMKSVQEKKKLYEAPNARSLAKVPPVRPKHLRVRDVTKQNFRNSFTTEDADLFMKTPKVSGGRLLPQNPSVPPKPGPHSGSNSRSTSNYRDPNGIGFSNSLRDLTNAGLAERRKVEFLSPLQSPCNSVLKKMNDHPGPPSLSLTTKADLPSKKPQLPPKTAKTTSFITARRQQIKASKSESQVARTTVASIIKGEAPPRNSASSSDCDSLEDSDVDDTACFQSVNSQSVHVETTQNFESKAQKVANELLETEKVYVRKLHLIDQVFHMEIIRRNRIERFLPDEVIPQIFSNIKCIFQFHNDYLLSELSSCIKTWDEGPRVGQVMKKAAPFFKLYTEFVTNFSSASSLIAAWIAKSEKFAQLLDELQKHPECGNLTLQHHLLEPIQRVPRYQLLLAEYLRRLPEDSLDKEPVEDALKLVTEAAQHTNDEMKKMEKFKKLLDTCATLVHQKGENLVSINRELVREGKMTKISARDGSLLDRYLFLFNDILLVTTVLPLKIGFGQQYLVKSKLDICGMKVYEGDNEDHPNTFTIMSKQKSIEFTASTLDEKNEWLSEIWSVIKQFVDKERTKDKEFLQKIYQQGDELGKRAPTWVKDQDTSMCMVCSDAFRTFRRRHHCRACGKVVCKECSTHKLCLDFDREKLNRVCDVCYAILESCTSPKYNHRHKGPAVLGMKATSKDTVLCGYLFVSLDNKTWMKRWLVLHSNCALYIFKAKRDNAAADSLPLPGYRVEECRPDKSTRDNTFKIFHDKLPKVYFFSTSDRSFYVRWLESLKLAIVAELSSSPLPQAPPLDGSAATPPILSTNEPSLIDEINGELVQISPQIFQ